MVPSYYAVRRGLPMTSRQILSRHEGSYQEIWSQCSTVCSAPGVAFWGGEHSVLRGGLATCQTFPLRVYVGLEPVTVREEVTFGLQWVYGLNEDLCDGFGSPREETDEEITRLGRRLRKRDALCEEVSRMLTAMCATNRSYRIHVMSEFPSRMGGNWSGAFASALAGALFADNGLLDAADICAWSTTPGWKLRDLTSFRECNRWAWHFETLLHNGKASGYGTFCALAGSLYPICYITEARSDLGAGPPIDVINRKQDAHPWDGHETWLSHIRYTGFRFSDIWPAISQPAAVYGLLASGVSKDTGVRIERAARLATQLHQSHGATRLLLDERREILRDIPRDCFAVGRLMQTSDGAALLAQYYESLSVAGIEVFDAVRRLFVSEGGAVEGILPAVARALKGVHGNLVQIDQNWAMAEALIGQGSLVADRLGSWESVGFKLTGGGGGGFLLFVGPSGCDFEWELCRSIDTVRAAWSHNPASKRMAMLWSSTEGLEDSGLRIEACALSSTSDARFNALSRRPFNVRVLGGRSALENLHVFGRDVELMRANKDAVFAEVGSVQKQLFIRGKSLAGAGFAVVRVVQMLSELAAQGGQLHLGATAERFRAEGLSGYGEVAQLKYQLRAFANAVEERLGVAPSLEIGDLHVKTFAGGPPIYLVAR